MPRLARRAPGQGREAPATATAETPSRTAATNAITAAIPPFMLETPPHAPFVTTPAPPSNPPAQSIVPERNVPRRNARQQQQTPTANGTHPSEHSQVSVHALESTMSEADNAEEQSLLDAVHQEAEDANQLVGLRDISSLATWTLSSAKPGCALPQLRHSNPHLFWQSDGPQPHTLTLHFFKLVAIVKMRIYLDFDLDESYTPTKMKFYAGMSEGALVEFGTWAVMETTDPETGEQTSDIANVRGWIDVPLEGVGGKDARYHEVVEQEQDQMELDGKDKEEQATRQAQREFLSGHEHGKDQNEDADSVGDVLKAMVVQVRICENHQNGKDTHVRGFQVFARDEASMKDVRKKMKKKAQKEREEVAGEDEIVGLQPADWMGDPEIR